MAITNDGAPPYELREDQRDDLRDGPDADRLPWLESADTDEREGRDWRLLALLAALGLAVIAAAIAGVHWYRNRVVDGGTGGLIAAPAEPYKVKPADPGGMQVGGEGDAALAASEGGVPGNASINLDAAPETPVQGRRAAPGAAPSVGGGAIAVPGSGGRLTAARPGAATVRTNMGAGGGAVVQLGSYPSEAAANAEWSGKSRRFGYLAPLGKSVERAEVNGATVWRLRVNAGSAGAARELCGKLKVAGEACYIPN